VNPLLATNSVFHAIGELFQPLFRLIGGVLAFIYGVIPNYAIAIALLTVIIMLLLTPLTVKSTKSMIAMQRLQPEIKKLQTKYKGTENRQKLNEEMMALYKQQGVNPAGGCLPLFLQMPFLIILYDTIRGLTTMVNGHVQPRYIPKAAHGTTISLVDKMYHNLVTSHGKMVAFGVNLADKPFAHGLSTSARIPLFVLVGLAVGFQYFQMRQMNSRNPQAAANKQMQTIQKVTPILFAYIYFLIPAAVVIYMIVSTLIRIGTQEIMFRTGMVQPVGGERTIGGAKRRIGAAASAPALVEETGTDTPPKTAPKTAPRANGSRSAPRPPAARNGKRNSNTNGSGSTNGEKPAAHPRARGKRPRKAR
jgi:YidC/Oxa1 family membrane protein insertase